MRKVLIVIALFCASAVCVNAQNPLSKGSKQFNAGLGFDSWGLPIYIGMDFGVHPDISVGGELSFASENHASQFGIIGNGNYHFNNVLEIPSNWDFYAGLNLGIYIYSWDKAYYGGSNSTSDFNLGFQIGGRYYFSSKWAINLEFRANSFPDGKIGVSYKL
jgi:hypothetical protein